MRLGWDIKLTISLQYQQLIKFISVVNIVYQELWSSKMLGSSSSHVLFGGMLSQMIPSRGVAFARPATRRPAPELSRCLACLRGGSFVI